MAVEQRARVAEQLKPPIVSHWESRRRHGQCPPAGHAVPDRMRSIQSRFGWKLASRVIRLLHMASASAGVVCRDPGQTVIQIVEHRLMPFQSRPHARALLVLALVVGAATAGRAQSPATPQPSPLQTPPATPAAQSGRRIRPPGRRRSLSIDEAVQLALQQNLGIQIERLNPQLQDHTIAQALANYTPIAGLGGNWRNQDSPPSSFLSGSSTTITDERYGFRRQYAQLFPWGTNALVSFDSNRSTTNNIFNSFNPQLTGNLDLTVTQPLLRNFKFDTVNQQIYVGRKNREVADVDLQQTIALTTRTVKNAYWDYVFSITSLDVARQSLDLAQESLRNTRTRVEIGTLAPIDVVAGRGRSRAARGGGDSGRGVNRADRRSAALAHLRSEHARLLDDVAQADRHRAVPAAGGGRAGGGVAGAGRAHRPHLDAQAVGDHRLQPEVLQEPDAAGRRRAASTTTPPASAARS